MIEYFIARLESIAHRKHSHPIRHSRSQGMVEFALALPIILLLMFGIIEFGRFFAIYISVDTASREAARYGSVVGTSPSSVPYYQDCAGIRDAAMRIGFFAGLQTGDIAIRYDSGPEEPLDWDDYPSCPSEVTLGDRIVVRVQATFEPIVPLVGLSSIPITSIAARTIIKSVDIMGTPPDTPTPKATRTPTITPTLTPTPTNTPTSTPTDTPDVCAPYSTSGAFWHSQEFHTYIVNNSAEIAVVDSITVSWDLSATLDKVSFGGTELWSGSSSSPFIFSDFSSLPAGTDEISASSSKLLKILFSNASFVSNLNLDIVLENGCTITYP